MKVTSEVFNPLWRSSIGFEKFVDDFFNNPSFTNVQTSYPPYNIVKKENGVYEIILAAAGFQKDDIIENQELIIEQILTHINGTELIVQSLLPVNETMLGSPGYLNKLIRYINKELKSHCEARKLTYLNLYPSFLEGEEMKRDYTTDGGHLSADGYSLWADLLKPFLKY